MKHWSNKLLALDACQEAIDWAKRQPTLVRAWKNCERGDWMLWLLAIKCKSKTTHRQIVLAARGWARLALRFIPPTGKRPLHAIEATEAWTKPRGIVSISPEGDMAESFGIARGFHLQGLKRVRFEPPIAI